MSALPGRRAERIAEDISRTREAMDGTLSAIEERLNARHLVDEGKRYLRTHGPGKYVSRAAASARRNPFPLALAGIAGAVAAAIALGRRSR